MKKYLLFLLLPLASNAQKDLTTSPDWFILDSASSVIPRFNDYVLGNANGFTFSRIDSASERKTYSYKNGKNEKLDVWYQLERSSGTIVSFGVKAPNDVMISFYNHYLKTEMKTCEEVCYISGRTFVYKTHKYIVQASQQTYNNGKNNGYASVAFSDSR